MKSTAAGKLIHRITIQKRQQTNNTKFGGKDQSWVEVSQRWANVDFSKGSETVDSDKITNTIIATITIRHMPSLTDDMRISYKDKNYEIISIVPDFQNRFQMLFVRLVE